MVRRPTHPPTHPLIYNAHNLHTHTHTNAGVVRGCRVSFNESTCLSSPRIGSSSIAWTPFLTRLVRRSYNEKKNFLTKDESADPNNQRKPQPASQSMCCSVGEHGYLYNEDYGVPHGLQTRNKTQRNATHRHMTTPHMDS